MLVFFIWWFKTLFNDANIQSLHENMPQVLVIQDVFMLFMVQILIYLGCVQELKMTSEAVKSFQ